MKASSVDITGPTSLLFKSPWGFGKTLAAASFAIAGPTYLAYWDKKKPVELVTFFKRFGDKGRKILDNLDYDVYGAKNANEYLNKLSDLSSNCRYIAVITDSVTTLTAGAVNWSSGFNDKGKHIGLKTENPQQLIPGFDEYKSETAIVSQALDICRTLPAHIIWTAHPLPGIRIEGSGSSMKVSKVNSLVTYGSKVAGIVPGEFAEIYHFSKSTDYSVNPSRIKYTVSTEAIGDEFAKTALGLPKELDITDRLFYEVWLEALQEVQNSYKLKENENVTSAIEPTAKPFIPSFANPIQTIERETNKKWNSEKGAYE
jgi:hypothetical protein